MKYSSRGVLKCITGYEELLLQKELSLYITFQKKLWTRAEWKLIEEPFIIDIN